MSFDNIILQQINLSFEKGTANFNVDSSEIVLSYLLFNNFKVYLLIPFYTPRLSKNIDIYSFYLSHSKSLYFRYQEILKIHNLL